MAGPRRSETTGAVSGKPTVDGGRPSAPPTWRRWVRFRPGLTLALGAIILLWATLRDGFPGGRPRIEQSRAREATAAVPPPPAAPELGWLLARKDALGLKSVQVEMLQRVQERWDRDTQGLREALDLASAQFNRDRGAPGAHGVNIQALRAKAAPVSDLSRQLAQARLIYWSEASQILTRPQRRQAEEAWTRGLGLRSGIPSSQ